MGMETRTTFLTTVHITLSLHGGTEREPIYLYNFLLSNTISFGQKIPRLFSCFVTDFLYRGTAARNEKRDKKNQNK
jgi:hypothetical protein